jgi:hypothetical protein
VTTVVLWLQVRSAASTCCRCTPQQATGALLLSHTSRLTLSLVSCASSCWWVPLALFWQHMHSRSAVGWLP